MVSKEKQNMEQILSFKRTFYDINNRDALDSEIIDNLKDKIEMNFRDLNYLPKQAQLDV